MDKFADQPSSQQQQVTNANNNSNKFQNYPQFGQQQQQQPANHNSHYTGASSGLQSRGELGGGSHGKSLVEEPSSSFLEITGANLDSSHPQKQSTCNNRTAGLGGSSPWRREQYSDGSVSSSCTVSSASNGSRASVNDTAKCIAVVGSTATTNSSSLTVSSSQSQPYLSARTSCSTSPVSTSSFTTGRQQQQLHLSGSAVNSVNNKSGDSSPSSSVSSQQHHSQQYHQPRASGSSSSGTASPSKSCTPNSIDTFIKENEQFFQSGNKLSRSVGLIETDDRADYLTDQDLDLDLDFVDSDSVEGNMKIQQNKLSSLTDDEKALLHETLKVGLYGVIGDPKKRQQMLNSQNGQNCGGDSLDMENTDQTTHLKPNRRIILVSKPAPKPEPKPEPKYVNGKVVFGQLPVKPVLQKGSVAERVMLFEKCPEKTSVTKGKLHELQKNRITNPNKIGSWVRSVSVTFAAAIQYSTIAQWSDALCGL